MSSNLKKGDKTVPQNENAVFYAALKAKGINISQLSRKSHISRTTLTDIAKMRKNNITLDTVRTICACLGCSAVEIFPDLKEK